MKILVFGDEEDLLECRQKFGNDHHYQQGVAGMSSGQTADVVFDFLKDHTLSAESYNGISAEVVFVNAVTTIIPRSIRKPVLFGFPGMRGFIKRELLEASAASESDHNILADICQRLGTSYQLVANRAGLITPRVICMLINEAFYAAEQQVATRADIDKAMKLGTSYPFGPFEWCDLIGIHHVYQLLQAVYAESKDERYQICPLLEKEFLSSKNAK